MTREYRHFTREDKIKAVKMVLIDEKSQMEVERIVLGKKKKGLKKVEITEENVRHEILKKFNAFLGKEIRTNFNSLKNSKKNTQ